jgi:hypothetical protein
MKDFVIAITASIALTLAIAFPAHAVTYGGDATGAEVTVTATGTTIRAATGSVPISGSMAHAALLVGDIPSSATGGVVALTASTMHSAVVGVGGATNAESSIGAVGLTVSGNQISTDFIRAQSKASCGPGPAVSGSAELLNLVVNGQPTTVTGAPNQTITLPNGTAIINAQVPTINGTSGELAVTAIRVMTHDTITGQPIADVLLSTVDAKIDCQGASSLSEEWVTGGGWVDSTAGTGKATFGFVAGRSAADGSVKGHFTLKDHTLGVTIHGDVIANFMSCTGTPADHSEFLVTDTASGQQVTVKVNDNGEPGANRDAFSVEGAAYSNPGPLLRGGNIQAHGFACP